MRSLGLRTVPRPSGRPPAAVAPKALRQPPGARRRIAVCSPPARTSGRTSSSIRPARSAAASRSTLTTTRS